MDFCAAFLVCEVKIMRIECLLKIIEGKLWRCYGLFVILPHQKKYLNNNLKIIPV